jgi:hypothetical protein
MPDGKPDATFPGIAQQKKSAPGIGALSLEVTMKEA